MRRAWLIAAFTATLSCSAAAAEPVPAPSDLMARVEKQTATFIDRFSEVKCTESVEQSKLTPKGKVQYKANSRYDYLLIANTADGDLQLDESRLEEQSAAKRNDVSLLLTNGFATQLLVFHPSYQHAYEFFDEGLESLNGQSVRKIRFRHLRGQKTPTVLLLRGREYPLEMTGVAWVDPATGIVERIESDLQFDMSDIGLKALHTEVNYAPVRFRGVNETPWLPAVAQIEVQTPKQRWRNIHRFERYQQFGVETEHKDEAPTMSKAQ